MEDVININEYVRTEEGYIGKLVEYIPNALNYLKIDIGREIKHCDDSIDNFIYTRYGFQLKHSKNIIDLIEEGDIIKYKELFDNEMYGTKAKETYILNLKSQKEVDKFKKCVEDKEIAFISVVTHEQFAGMEYKVNE